LIGGLLLYALWVTADGVEVALACGSDA